MTDDYILDFVFIKPNKQIRIEKPVIGDEPSNSEYTFNAKRSYYTIAAGKSYTTSVETDQQLPLFNYLSIASFSSSKLLYTLP